MLGGGSSAYKEPGAASGFVPSGLTTRANRGAVLSKQIIAKDLVDDQSDGWESDEDDD